MMKKQTTISDWPVSFSPNCKGEHSAPFIDGSTGGTSTAGRQIVKVGAEVCSRAGRGNTDDKLDCKATAGGLSVHQCIS